MQDIISDLRHVRHLIIINTVCVVLPSNLIKLFTLFTTRFMVVMYTLMVEPLLGV